MQRGFFHHACIFPATCWSCCLSGMFPQRPMCSKLNSEVGRLTRYGAQNLPLPFPLLATTRAAYMNHMLPPCCTKCPKAMRQTNHGLEPTNYDKQAFLCQGDRGLTTLTLMIQLLHTLFHAINNDYRVNTSRGL